MRAEVNGVLGELHECLLQRSVLGGQFEDGQAGLPGDSADLLGGQAPHVQDAGLLAGHGDVRAEQQVAQPGRLRGAHGDRAAPGAGRELPDRGVSDQPPPADDDQPGRGQRHLAHQVRGHEHGTALGRQALEQVPDPQHPLWVQPVDRLVEDHDAGIAQQRRGDAQPLAHPQGEPANPLAGHVLQSGHADHLIDPPPADAVGLRQRQQVVAGRPAGVHRPGLQQDAQLRHRRRRRAIILAVQPGDHPHRGRLAGPVRAEKARDDAGPDNKVQAIDRQLLPVSLTDVLYLYHACSLHCRCSLHHQR